MKSAGDAPGQETPSHFTLSGKAIFGGGCETGNIVCLIVTFTHTPSLHTRLTQRLSI